MPAVGRALQVLWTWNRTHVNTRTAKSRYLSCASGARVHPAQATLPIAAPKAPLDPFPTPLP